jgi:hypothetical protein
MRDRTSSSFRAFSTGASAGLLAVAFVAAVAAPAAAQPGGIGATPLAVDLKKVPIGSWAEYKIAFGDQAAQARWALVGRKPDNVTIEMTMEGGPAAQMGGKMTARLVMAPDPTKVDRAVKQMVMQLEGQDPMEMPTQGTNQKFEKPDPKKLVGKETISVPAGSFPTSHYRDSANERGNIDMWISETVPPLGLVKLSFVPKAGSPMPTVGMELSGKGKDAKATITKTPKPFDPAMMMGAMRGGRPGAGGPGGPAGHGMGAPGGGPAGHGMGGPGAPAGAAPAAPGAAAPGSTAPVAPKH